MINWPLLRWEMRNIRWWYAGLFIFLIGILSLLLFATTGPVNWEKMDFFLFGSFWALLGGMAIVSSKLKKGTLAFLLARPVSRRELYHAMALAGGAAHHNIDHVSGFFCADAFSLACISHAPGATIVT